MILFKACPRCGGDVDATYQDDVCCVQCSHRPEVAYPGPRVVHQSSGASMGGGPITALDPQPDVPTAIDPSATKDPSTTSCPRYDSSELIRLDRLRQGITPATAAAGAATSSVRPAANGWGHEGQRSSNSFSRSSPSATSSPRQAHRSRKELHERRRLGAGTHVPSHEVRRARVLFRQLLRHHEVLALQVLDQRMVGVVAFGRSL